MQLHNVEQGTIAWQQARMGIPTASGFEKIITPTGKASTQAEAYSEKLLAEYILGYPVETFTGNAHTDRGKELEPQAVKFYEAQRELDTTPVGFCTTDDGTIPKTLAARYCGVPVSRFAGVCPMRPVRIAEKLKWDIKDLDKWIDSIKNEEADDEYLDRL